MTLPGGTITISGTWRDSVTGETSPIYLATSTHTGESGEFYTYSCAEYLIWAINERIESRNYRLSLSA